MSPNARVIILASEDALRWEEVYRFRVARRDTRDPHFLIFQDRLFVYTGTWYSGEEPARAREDRDLNLHLGDAVSTAEGTAWTVPVMLEGTFGHYVWPAAAFDGIQPRSVGPVEGFERRTIIASQSCRRLR